MEVTGDKIKEAISNEIDGAFNYDASFSMDNVIVEWHEDKKYFSAQLKESIFLPSLLKYQ